MGINKNQKVLIVGGNGYIGSQTNLELLQNGFETVVFDKQKPKFLNSIFSDFKSEFFNGNILNLNDLKKVFEIYNIVAVIHFAAEIEVGESEINPEKYYINNVVGSLNLFKIMMQFGVKNIVFSSTAAVYGVPKRIPIKESYKKEPINTYGRTKWMIEQILSDYCRSYGLNAISFRYFNACGADLENRTGENHNPETHLIPLIFMAINGERESIKIFGDDYSTPDGTCVRDYIHTKDLAVAHLFALKRLLLNVNLEGLCQSINLGSKQGFSVKEIIEKVRQVTGCDFKVEITERRAGDPDRLVADNSMAQKFLDFEAKYSDLDTIIKTAWEWEQKRRLLNS